MGAVGAQREDKGFINPLVITLDLLVTPTTGLFMCNILSLTWFYPSS